MKTTKFSSIALAMLMTSLCLFFTTNVNAHAATINANNSIQKIEVEPRELIQCFGGYIVFQPYPELISVIVIRKSDGATVFSTNSSSAEIYFSTSGWSAGEYKVETNNQGNEYQEFYFEL